MKINQKRIRNLERYLPVTFKNRHINIGFTAGLSVGETVLLAVVAYYAV